MRCSDEILDRNEMNLVSKFVDLSKDIWVSANCDNCYATASAKTQNFSLNTQAFLEKFKIHNDCVQKLRPNTSAICSECKISFENLNGFYKQIEESSGYRLCFDLVDQVTRSQAISDIEITPSCFFRWTKLVKSGQRNSNARRSTSPLWPLSSAHSEWLSSPSVSIRPSTTSENWKKKLFKVPINLNHAKTMIPCTNFDPPLREHAVWSRLTYLNKLYSIKEWFYSNWL